MIHLTKTPRGLLPVTGANVMGDITDFIALEDAKEAMDRVNYDFVAGLEGKALTTAYVPSANSGVTIGTGVDLKMKDANFLRSIGVTDNIIKILEPYFGLSGDAARKYIKDNPLILSDENTAILDKASKGFELNRIKTAYEKDSSKQWSDLSSSQQTVLYSVGQQYGNLAARTPKFWKSYINNDWEAVIKELNNFGDAYPTRRRKEADYLNRGE